MQRDDLEEARWVRRVQDGETEVFENLILRFQKPVFNLLYRYLADQDEAADVAQEVFIAAFKSIRKFRGEARFSTWLYRIAINRAKNRRQGLAKQRQRSVPEVLSDPDDLGEVCDGVSRLTDLRPAADLVFEEKETQRRVQEGIKKLKSDESLLILLHDLQGVSYEEMTQILDVPLGTVKSRLHRARQALKGWLLPYFSERLKK